MTVPILPNAGLPPIADRSMRISDIRNDCRFERRYISSLACELPVINGGNRNILIHWNPRQFFLIEAIEQNQIVLTLRAVDTKSEGHIFLAIR